VLAGNLSPRLSELHLVHAISGHFQSYVQRALLSASVRNVQDALTFLRSLEAMEQGDEKGRPNSDVPYNHRNTQNGSGGSGQGRFDRNRNNYHHVRNNSFRGHQNYYGNRQNSRHDGGQREVFTARDNTTSGTQDCYSESRQEGLNPRAVLRNLSILAAY
jgi:hypothetical protein